MESIYMGLEQEVKKEVLVMSPSVCFLPYASDNAICPWKVQR